MCGSQIVFKLVLCVFFLHRHISLHSIVVVVISKALKDGEIEVLCSL